GAALDIAHGAVERRVRGLQLFERCIDEPVDPFAQSRGELGQKRPGAIEGREVERSVEALQDRVIDGTLLAMIDLQLALGVVDIFHAEEVLEQELLRALAEVLELSGGDRLEGREDRIAERVTHVSVEHGLRSAARGQLQLPPLRSGEARVGMASRGKGSAEVAQQLGAALRLLRDGELLEQR